MSSHYWIWRGGNSAISRTGETVVLFGVGGISLNIAYAKSLVSTHPVSAVDLQDINLELAKQIVQLTS